MAPIHRSETGSAPSDQRGFTLTELLVVLAIIGLLTMAVPVLLQAALPGTRSLAATRALAEDLRAARSDAIAGGRTTAIGFDAAKQTYVRDAVTHRIPNAVPFALPRSAPAETIAFYPDGSSSGGSVIVGEGALRHRVAIDWLTGRVSVDE
jgi:general secretion pathway protein H